MRDQETLEDQGEGGERCGLREAICKIARLQDSKSITRVLGVTEDTKSL